MRNLAYNLAGNRRIMDIWNGWFHPPSVEAEVQKGLMICVRLRTTDTHAIGARTVCRVPLQLELNFQLNVSSKNPYLINLSFCSKLKKSQKCKAGNMIVNIHWTFVFSPVETWLVSGSRNDLANKISESWIKTQNRNIGESFRKGKLKYLNYIIIELLINTDITSVTYIYFKVILTCPARAGHVSITLK